MPTAIQRPVLLVGSPALIDMDATIAKSRKLQRALIGNNEDAQWLLMPRASDDVLPGIRWGDADVCYTAAFWCQLGWQQKLERSEPQRHALGSDLKEELAACVLGGYGMPAEVGLAAYAAIRYSGLLHVDGYCAAEFERVLRTPLEINGRAVKYRFPVVKARQLAGALAQLQQRHAPPDGVTLRDWLRTFHGIGPKTASWIVRNRDPFARVAILDVHVIRACQILGLFPLSYRLPRDYDRLELAFLELADALGVLPSDLDAVMWAEMRASTSSAIAALNSAAVLRMSSVDC